MFRQSLQPLAPKISAQLPFGSGPEQLLQEKRILSSAGNLNGNSKKCGCANNYNYDLFAEN